MSFNIENQWKFLHSESENVRFNLQFQLRKSRLWKITHLICETVRCNFIISTEEIIAVGNFTSREWMCQVQIEVSNEEITVVDNFIFYIRNVKVSGSIRIFTKINHICVKFHTWDVKESGLIRIFNRRNHSCEKFHII